mmetsp:Transcript_103316/g.287604  ORF Transcript_103316/g.287604 Transcript_103316/m.287604 type:complete len:213 (-) Transcript_103316:592-1230(-)
MRARARCGRYLFWSRSFDVLGAQGLDPPGAAPQGAVVARGGGLGGGAALRGQAVGQADGFAALRLGWRDDHVTLALQPHGAHVLQAPVLEELRELGVTQSSLAQLYVKPRTEEPLHVGQRDGVDPRGQGPDELMHACMQRVPIGDGASLPCGIAAWPLVLRAALLDHGLRAAVWHDGTIEIAEDLLLGDGQLHNVADLAERTANKKRQLTGR